MIVVWGSSSPEALLSLIAILPFLLIHQLVSSPANLKSGVLTVRHIVAHCPARLYQGFLSVAEKDRPESGPAAGLISCSAKLVERQLIG